MLHFYKRGENIQFMDIQTDKQQWQTDTTIRPATIYQDAPVLATGPSPWCEDSKSHNCECTKKSRPSRFEHTITPMSLTLNSCDLLPSSQPTFFSRCPALPRQRAGKLQLTHLFSQSQTVVELLLAYGHVFGFYVKNGMWSGKTKCRLDREV